MNALRLHPIALLALAACSGKKDTTPLAEPVPATAPEPVDSREPGDLPPGATAPVLGEDGVPVDCNVLYEGHCYAVEADACKEAGCPDDGCIVLEVYPGQISCEDTI